MSFRDVIVFLAGAEAFHTISHLIVPFLFKLPIETHWFLFTSTINLWAVILNAIVTAGLLWYASRLPK